MKRATSDWFLAYTLLLIICALTCQVTRTLAHHLGRHSATAPDPYRGAVDRIIADTIPPGWTTEHSPYITHIKGPGGIARAFTYIGLVGDGRPLLVATPLATPARTPVTWDLTEPRSPDNFKAWLAEVTPPPTGGIATGSAALGRPSARRRGRS